MALKKYSGLQRMGHVQRGGGGTPAGDRAGRGGNARRYLLERGHVDFESARHLEEPSGQHRRTVLVGVDLSADVYSGRNSPPEYSLNSELCTKMAQNHRRTRCNFGHNFRASPKPPKVNQKIGNFPETHHLFRVWKARNLLRSIFCRVTGGREGLGEPPLPRTLVPTHRLC